MYIISVRIPSYICMYRYNLCADGNVLCVCTPYIYGTSARITHTCTSYRCAHHFVYVATDMACARPFVSTHNRKRSKNRMHSILRTLSIVCANKKLSMVCANKKNMARAEMCWVSTIYV